MPDTRHFDAIEKVVADQRRLLDDHVSTVLARLSKAGIAVVTATSEIVAPYAGQLIVNATDNMLYEWNGAAWIGVLAMGGSGAQIHDAKYYQSTLQTINNVTDTKLRFQTAITTSNDVTASGTGNQDFQLNRAGLWLVTASIAWATTSADALFLFLSTGTNIATITNRIASQSASIDGSATSTQSVSTVLRASAGTSVFAGVFQNSGAGLNTDVGFGTQSHISLTWIRP